MKVRRATVFAVLVGAVVGAGMALSLHAQVQLPVYVVAEIEVTNPDAYMKEYSPVVIKVITAAGGTYLARGPQLSPVNGVQTARRVSITRFDSMEKAKAVYSSADYRNARAIGDKYAKINLFAVQGIP